MDLETFKQNYDLTRSGRAVEKSAVVFRPDLKTADGEIFEASKLYYFFDSQNLRVSESAGFAPVGEYLTANGLRVVSIDRLRSSKNAALTDGQDRLRDEIKKRSELIAGFELAKTPLKTKTAPGTIQKEDCIKTGEDSG